MAIRVEQTPLIIETGFTGTLRIGQASLVFEIDPITPLGMRVGQGSLTIEVDPLDIHGLRIGQVGLIFEINPTSVVVTGGAFQDPFGNPYSNGKVTFQLSADGFDSIDSVEISSGVLATANLDTNGNIIQPFSIWPNSLLTTVYGHPTYYRVRVYTERGQLVWDSPVTIPDFSFDFGGIVPKT